MFYCCGYPVGEPRHAVVGFAIRSQLVNTLQAISLGGGAIVQLPCTGHPTNSTPADYGTGTDTGLQSYPLQDRLLQRCAPRCSKLQHQEVAVITELRSSNRSRSTKTIPRQPVAEDVTLAARSAEDRLQSGSADFQSPQHLDPVVPATPNPGSRTRPQPAIDHYGAASTFHDDNICETRFSILCTSCLELTTKNCS